MTADKLDPVETLIFGRTSIDSELTPVEVAALKYYRSVKEAARPKLCTVADLIAQLLLYNPRALLVGYNSTKKTDDAEVTVCGYGDSLVVVRTVEPYHGG